MELVLKCVRNLGIEKRKGMSKASIERNIVLMKTDLDIWETQFHIKEEESMMKWKLNESGEWWSIDQCHHAREVSHKVRIER